MSRRGPGTQAPSSCSPAARRQGRAGRRSGRAGGGREAATAQRKLPRLAGLRQQTVRQSHTWRVTKSSSSRAFSLQQSSRSREAAVGATVQVRLATRLATCGPGRCTGQRQRRLFAHAGCAPPVHVAGQARQVDDVRVAAPGPKLARVGYAAAAAHEVRHPLRRAWWHNSPGSATAAVQFCCREERHFPASPTATSATRRQRRRRRHDGGLAAARCEL